MIKVRKSNQRGYADHGWLQAKHTFSFANYFDPENMGFRSLRVINEDQVAPSEGFGTHGHSDMEIITYVIEGELEHKDSMGNGSIIKPGEIQYMSAGTGVKHSEFNASLKNKVHLLQIWILPDKKNYSPAYDQKSFSNESRSNQLLKVASGNKLDTNIITVRQDMHLYTSILDAKKEIKYETQKNRGIWLQLVRGNLVVNGLEVHTGDGVQIESETVISILANEKSEFLLFDLA